VLIADVKVHARAQALAFEYAQELGVARNHGAQVADTLAVCDQHQSGVRGANRGLVNPETALVGRQPAGCGERLHGPA
jgi:hypothetical protein